MSPPEATFSDLPDEIAQEIFISCLDELDQDVEHPQHSQNAPTKLSNYPILFTSVCKHWTRLALAHPRLWSTISIVIRYPGTVNQSTPPLPVVAKWVERSSPMPLVFSIKQFGQSCKPYDAPKRVLELLIPHHLRWKRVFMSLDSRCATGLSLLSNTAGATPYPELRHISLRSSRCWDDSDLVEGDAAGIVHLLEHAPRLVVVNINLAPPTVSFRGSPMSEDSQRRALDSIRAAIPWCRAEDVSFSTNTLTPLRALELLGRECLNLRSGIFRVCRDIEDESEDESEDEDEDDLSNPHQFQQLISLTKGVEYPLAYNDRLETLRLLSAPIDAPLIILKHATLPKLRNLALPIHYGTINGRREAWKEKVLADEFENFIRRSGCDLEQLRYVSNSYSSSESLCPPPILQCLRSVSTSLQVLHLVAYNNDALLKALTVREGPESNHILCPTLHTIQLKSWNYEGNGLLADMVESRWNPPNELLMERLRSVNMRFILGGLHDGLESEGLSILNGDVPRLQALGEDGSGRKISLTVRSNAFRTKLV